MRSKEVYVYLALVMLILTAPPFYATMGYDIEAKIDSSGWALHRHTFNMNFTSDGSVSGSGNFSKRTRLQDLDGLRADEYSSSLNGSLKYEEKVRYISREGPVKITANLKEYDLDNPDNPNFNVTAIGDYANIDVDERWPAYFADLKSIQYVGSGIRTRETYYNNGDVVSTFFNSWRLKKESLYRGRINRTIIHAKITPQSVLDERQMNKTSSFILFSNSTGSLTRLQLSRSSLYSEPTRFGRTKPNSLISQDYMGRQTINLRVGMNDSVITKIAPEWLYCCSGNTTLLAA